MGTSTNRPKPKSGQSAAKNGNSQPGGTQEKQDAAEPVTQTTAAAETSSAETSGGVAAAAETTAGAGAASAATTSAPPAAKSASGTLPSAPKTSEAKPAARPANAKPANKTPPAPPRTVPARVLTAKPAPKRDSRREELSRKIEERRVQRERELRNRRIKKWSLIGIPSAVVVVVLGIFIYNLLFGPQVAPYLRGAAIDGIECNAGEQLYSHYHAHLQIYVDGQNIPIPTDVGRQAYSGCYYWLHTHPIAGDAGVIHIESPDTRTYSVKEFFDIWGQEISATSLMGHKVTASEKMTAFVYNSPDQPTDDTQPWTVTPPSNLAPYSGDPSQITLKPHELIVVEYGTPVVPISAFSFDAGE